MRVGWREYTNTYKARDAGLLAILYPSRKVLHEVQTRRLRVAPRHSPKETDQKPNAAAVLARLWLRQRAGRSQSIQLLGKVWILPKGGWLLGHDRGQHLVFARSENTQTRKARVATKLVLSWPSRSVWRLCEAINAKGLSVEYNRESEGWDWVFL